MQIKLGTDFKANVEQGLEPEQKKKQEKGKEDFETRFSHCSKVSIDPIYPPKVSKCIHWSKLGIYPTYPRYLALATKATSLKQWQCQNVMCDLYCRWFFEISQYFATVEENYKITAGRSSPSSLQLVVRNVEETLFQHQPPETTTQIELFSNINFAQFSLLKKNKKIKRELLSIWMSTLQKYENEWFTNPKMWRKLTEIRLKAPRPPVRVSIIGRSNFLGSEWRGRRRKIEATTSLVVRKSGKPSTNHLWLRLWSGPPTISKIQANHTYMILFQPRLQCVVL